jgi:hypothetical protein
MTFQKIKAVAIILILIISGGCLKKDDLTLPVKVSFKIGIQTDHISDYQYLNISECQIGISSIQFEGKREAGGDIFFETDSKMNLQTLSFFQPILITVFDIPQGIYDYMKWDISMKCINTEGLIEDRDGSFPCIGIILSGEYKYLDGSEIPVVFAIDEPELFSVRAYDPNNYSRIVLSVNKEYEAIVFFAPGYAFLPISRESFETAEVSGDSMNRKIIISSTQNEDLYEILLYRIIQSAKVVFK